jgi:hypothetical protein
VNDIISVDTVTVIVGIPLHLLSRRNPILHLLNPLLSSIVISLLSLH